MEVAQLARLVVLLVEIVGESELLDEVVGQDAHNEKVKEVRALANLMNERTDQQAAAPFHKSRRGEALIERLQLGDTRETP